MDYHEATVLLGRVASWGI